VADFDVVARPLTPLRCVRGSDPMNYSLASPLAVRYN
jgi:hypothetical protein